MTRAKRLQVCAKYGDRDMYNSSWKYNHWEQKGCPRNVEQKSARVMIRYSGEKVDMHVDGVAVAIERQARRERSHGYIGGGQDPMYPF